MANYKLDANTWDCIRSGLPYAKYIDPETLEEKYRLKPKTACEQWVLKDSGVYVWIVLGSGYKAESTNIREANIRHQRKIGNIPMHLCPLTDNDSKFRDPMLFPEELREVRCMNLDPKKNEDLDKCCPHVQHLRNVWAKKHAEKKEIERVSRLSAAEKNEEWLYNERQNEIAEKKEKASRKKATKAPKGAE